MVRMGRILGRMLMRLRVVIFLYFFMLIFIILLVKVKVSKLYLNILVDLPKIHRNAQHSQI